MEYSQLVSIMTQSIGMVESIHMTYLCIPSRWKIHVHGRIRDPEDTCHGNQQWNLTFESLFQLDFGTAVRFEPRRYGVSVLGDGWHKVLLQIAEDVAKNLPQPRRVPLAAGSTEIPFDKLVSHYNNQQLAFDSAQTPIWWLDVALGLDQPPKMVSDY